MKQTMVAIKAKLCALEKFKNASSSSTPRVSMSRIRLDAAIQASREGAYLSLAFDDCVSKDHKSEVHQDANTYGCVYDRLRNGRCV